MKLSTYAKELGVSYKTVWRLWKQGHLDAYQLPTGTVIVKDELENKIPNKVCIYFNYNFFLCQVIWLER